jgi:hypothetical protein
LQDGVARVSARLWRFAAGLRARREGAQFDDARREGAINRYVVVGGWQKITTPAGTFDAIQLRVIMPC